MIARRTIQSRMNAYNRAVSPAGRNSSRMPSGVSATMTVSRTSGELRRSSGLDDDGVGNLVVQTLPRLAEDEQMVNQRVERDEPEQSIDDVAEPEQPTERDRRTIGSHHLDVEDFLAEGLTVSNHGADGQNEPGREPERTKSQADPQTLGWALSHEDAIGETVQHQAQHHRQVHQSAESDAVQHCRTEAGAATCGHDLGRWVDDILDDRLGRRVRIAHRRSCSGAAEFTIGVRGSWILENAERCIREYRCQTAWPSAGCRRATNHSVEARV